MKVFISYAHEDAVSAGTVARALEALAVTALIDSDQIAPGESFVSFMERGISTADYCLLLWSATASTKQWVRVEWEAALTRSVRERQVFLLVGLLDTHPLPTLLAPRLAVDLHPTLDPGMHRLSALLSADARTAQVTGDPVVPPSVAISADAGAPELYVVSELFATSLPLRVDLQRPIASLVERLRKELDLPTQWDHKGLFGEHFSYSLSCQGKKLPPDLKLADAGITDGSVVTLELERRPFAATAPSRGEMTTTVFRGHDDLWVRSRRIAAKKLEAALRAQGFRPGRLAGK